jgi:hypothetical protein
MEWPAHRPSEERKMGFGDKAEIISLPHKRALDFFDRYFDHQRTTAGAPLLHGQRSTPALEQNSSGLRSRWTDG